MQSGYQGVQFERPTEQPDLHCVRVGQVHRSIASGTGVLRMVHLILGVELHAVTRSPSVELSLCSAAEPQEFWPEFFHEEYQAGDAFLLCFIFQAM